MRTFQAGDRVRTTGSGRLGTVVSVKFTPMLRVFVWVEVDWDVPTYAAHPGPTSVPAYMLTHAN